MKKLSLLFLSLVITLLPILNVNAAGYELLTRDESNNYGVKKNIEVNNSRLSYIKNTPYVSNAKNHVYDFADLLNDSEEEEIRKAAAKLKEKIDTEIVIYIMNNQSAYDAANEEDIAQDFYDYNDFGIDVDDQYSGVMLIINKLDNGSVSSGGAIGVDCYGNAQLMLDENRLVSIRNDIEGNFWYGRYYATVIEFLNLVEDYYDKGSWDIYGEYYLDEYGMLQKKQSLPVFPAICVSGIITLLVILILVNKNKMVKKAQNAAGYLDKGESRIEVSQDNFLRQTHHSYVMSSSSSGGGGGRSSFRGSSGRGSSRSGMSRR